MKKVVLVFRFFQRPVPPCHRECDAADRIVVCSSPHVPYLCVRARAAFDRLPSVYPQPIRHAHPRNGTRATTSAEEAPAPQAAADVVAKRRRAAAAASPSPAGGLDVRRAKHTAREEADGADDGPATCIGKVEVVDGREPLARTSRRAATTAGRSSSSTGLWAGAAGAVGFVDPADARRDGGAAVRGR